MASRAAKLPSNASYYRLFRSSWHVVSKAVTDAVPARCDGASLAMALWRGFSFGNGAGTAEHVSIP